MAESVERRLHVGEGQEFDFWLSQTNDLENEYLSLPSLMFGINMIGQVLVSSVQGQCV